MTLNLNICDKRTDADAQYNRPQINEILHKIQTRDLRIEYIDNKLFNLSSDLKNVTKQLTELVSLKCKKN